MSTLGQRSDIGEFRRRYRWHALLGLVVFFILIGRLFQLQILQGDEYTAAARENVIHRVTLATTRGMIRDAQGHVLASARPSYNVYVVPQQGADRRAVCLTQTTSWTKVVEYIRLTPEEKARFEQRLNDLCAEPTSDPRAKKYQQILLREDVGRDAVAVLETHASELKGVDVVPVPVRFYPYGEVGAHTLGYMAELDGEQLARLRSSGYIEGDRVGAAGVERGWESYLRGSRGWEKTVVDARNVRRTGDAVNRLLDEPRRLDPVPGRDLRLTLDMELVEAIDRAMRGQIAGSAVVVDVRTGRILALYSKPTFDPNVLSGGAGVQAIRDSFRRLYSDPLRPTLDKTMSGTYPPGSTYKPFSALAALEEKLVDPRPMVRCNGFYSYGKRIFRCTHIHGLVNMRQAIERSCNVYFYQLAEAVGLDRLAKMGLEYGFGQKTGVGVNPEAPGRIPTYSWYATHYKGQFRGGFTLNAAIGQGATTVTVLQLALAYGALANGGTLYQPQVVRAVETSDGTVVQDFPPRVRRRLQVHPENWSLVTNGLWGVVNDKEGTAFTERLADVDMAGKTGTAQTSHRRVANEDPNKSWYFNRDHAWFAGYSPFSSPEIAVAVLIEHGGVGGKNAAPVAFIAAREYQKLVQSRLTPKASARTSRPASGAPGKLGSMFREGLAHRAVEHFDWFLFLVTAMVAVIGVVNLYSATSVYTQSRADLYVSQVYFLVSGGALAIFVAAIDYRYIERFGYVLYVLGVLALVLVLVLGKDIRGSSRWINIGSFSFQPSEFMKLCLIIALGKYFQETRRSDAPRPLRELIVPALLAAVPVLLVLRQPDLGTGLILSLLFVSVIALLRIRWWSKSSLLFFSFLGVSVPFVWEYGLRDYQRNRLLSFLSPDANIRGAGYHAHNARIAIGNGGFFGQGYMKGTQNQYYFLPDQYTDFPFPVFAEDWGFAGSLALVTLYALLVFWSLRIASQAKDRFGSVVAVGVGSLMFWHTIFNLGMVTGLLPVVGVTLPLFSYGGSSVLTMLLGLGLLMNISMRRPNLTPVRAGQIILAR